MRANCENTRIAAAVGELVMSDLEQHVELALAVTRASALDDREPRIAADLAQLEQRVEDRDRRAREAALLDVLRTSACAATRMLS